MKLLSETDLAKIEKELKIILPKHYKEFHLKNTDLITQLRESDINSDDNTMWVATDITHIIEYNKMLGLPKETGPTKGKLYIGGNGSGDSALINLEKHRDKKVYFVGPMNYSETFDEEIDDFNWKNKETIGGKNLKKFVKEKIDSNQGY